MKRTLKKRPRPSHYVYVVEGDQEESFWTKVGAAWPHEDGLGYGVALCALPLDGRLVIRVPKEADEAEPPVAPEA